MLRRYYGKISKLPIDQFVGHDGELVVDDVTGKVYVMDGVTYGGIELVGATPRFGIDPPITPTPGTLWYDPQSGRTYIYFQDTWVDAAPNTTYSLPEASTTRLGGIKVGNNLSIDEFGVLNAEDGNYILPTANNTVLGGVKVDNVSILINGNGVISANIADIKSNISILFSNAEIQSSNIATLVSNASTQAALINAINANVAAANTAISSKTVSNLTNNGHTVSLGSNGNVTLPAGGYINFANGHSIIEGITDGIGDYVLPVADSNTLGGIKLGEGFTKDGSNKVTTSKLYSTNLTQPTQHYRLTLDTNGVVVLPDQSIINGATLQVVPGTGELNYAALAAGPNNTYPQKTWIWADAFGASISTDSYATNNVWHFDNDGNVILPASGSINYSNGASILEGITSSNSAPSSTPPGSPVEGQLWYDTDSGRIYVYLGDSWVDASPPLVSNTYDNSNVAAYLPTDSIIVSLRANASTQATYINTIFANLASQTSNSGTQQTTINYLLANALSQENKITALRANVTAANAAIVTANSAMKSYVDSLSTNWISNASIQAGYINTIFANLATQSGNAAAQQVTISYLVANSLTQDSQINSLRANVTAANAAIVTANVSMKTYVDDIIVAFQSDLSAGLEPFLLQIDANLAIQSSNSATQQNTINYLLANALSQENKITSLRANVNAANAAIVTANVGMKVYVDGVTTAWLANAAAQSAIIDDIYSNLSVKTSNAATQQNTINYLLANSLAQENAITSLRSNITAANSAISTNTASIATINANIAAANSVISTKTVYSNSNVAAYLTTYSGSIGGSITVGALLQAPQYTKASNATGTVGQICWDSNYIYVCTATNTWKRVGLTGGY